MTLLLIGVLLFGLPHLGSIIAPNAARGLERQMGQKAYKGAYALASLLGIVLMAWGYARARATTPLLYEPWTSGRHVVLAMILVAFILIFSNQSKGYIARLTHHPFSLGIVLWSTAHLLANGEASVVWIFATMLVIGLADVVFSLMRGKRATHVPTLKGDLRGVAAGVGLYLVFALAFHPYVVGIKVMP